MVTPPSPAAALLTHSTYLYLPYCREYFQKEQLNDHIDPDVTVAYGAASVLD